MRQGGGSGRLGVYGVYGPGVDGQNISYLGEGEGGEGMGLWV